MKIKREIFIEQERRVTIRFASPANEQFCPACRIAARFVTIDEAAIFGETSSRAIFRLIESETLHSLETQIGLLRVCLNSLSAVKNRNFLRREK